MTEKEQNLQYIRNWKVVGAELDRMKGEELRAMSEEESARIFDGLQARGHEDMWRQPERAEDNGMVEQQRIFMKAHAKAN